MTAFEKLVLEKFERLDKRFDKHDQDIAMLKEGQQEINQKIQRMDAKIEQMDSKIQKMDGKIQQMEVKINDMDDTIREMNEKLEKTYEIALDAWGHSVENRKLIAGI